jgi:hypothetical protein
VSSAKPTWKEAERSRQDHRSGLASFGDSPTCRKPPRPVIEDINTERETVPAGRAAVIPSTGIEPGAPLAEDSIAQLRRFFELLDRWEQESVNPSTAQGDSDEKGS